MSEMRMQPQRPRVEETQNRVSSHCDDEDSIADSISIGYEEKKPDRNRKKIRDRWSNGLVDVGGTHDGRQADKEIEDLQVLGGRDVCRPAFT